MRSFKPVKVTIKGQSYSASYEVVDGEVRLQSAYGSGTAKAGKDIKATAERLLVQVVEKWRP